MCCLAKQIAAEIKIANAETGNKELERTKPRTITDIQQRIANLIGEAMLSGDPLAGEAGVCTVVL